MYNKTIVKPAVRCTPDVVNPRSKEQFQVDFLIVDLPDVTPLLSSKTVQEMGLIHVNREEILKITIDKVFVEAASPSTLERARFETR